jgi:small subunit ribosomal protein S21
MATNCVVIVGRDELAESALKRLKNGLLKAGVFKEIKKREFYEKPSLRKRRKQAENKKRMRKRERQMAAALVRVTEKVEARKEFGGRIYEGNRGR